MALTPKDAVGALERAGAARDAGRTVFRHRDSDQQSSASLRQFGPAPNGEADVHVATNALVQIK